MTQTEGQFSGDYITRHADKGTWQVNEQELKDKLSGDNKGSEAAKILAILQETAEELNADSGKTVLDPKESPLKVEGLIRSRKLGQKIFEILPKGRSVLLVVDSKKPRAALTRAEAVGKIHEMETAQERPEEKMVDMLQIDEAEFVAMMQDEGTGSWDKYGEKMAKENLTENQAIAMQINDAAKGDLEVAEGNENYPDAAQRYRNVITQLKQRVTSENSPVIVFGVGHSGSLGYLKREETGKEFTADDIPCFCEIHKFDQKGKLQGTEKVEI